MGEVVSLADRRVAAESIPPLDTSIADYIKPASEWRLEWSRLQLADFLRHCAFWHWHILEIEQGRDSGAALYAKAQRSQAEHDWDRRRIIQLFVAAPSVGALRWKEQTARYYRYPEVTAALERDRAALAPRLAAIARQQAGRRKAAKLK